jgi:GT2 family glycosyltransferase
MRSESEYNRSECPEVAIIVLHWNNYEDTSDCLSSLKDIEYSNYKVYVVDNGSTDDSVNKLQAEFEWCEYITNEENLGFAAGNNVGIRQSLKEGSDYVLLLNNDMVIKTSTLKNLVKTGEKNDNIAAVGGIINNRDSDIIWYAGGKVNNITVSVSVLEDIPKAEEYETNFITGAMMLLSKDYLSKNGFLSEDYFFGMEDKELSHNAMKNGWKLMVNPSAKAEHKVSSSAGDRSPFWYYHSTINRLIFSNKNNYWWQQLLFYIFFITTRMIRFGQWLASGRTDLILATIEAAYDYISLGKPRRRTDLLE